MKITFREPEVEDLIPILKLLQLSWRFFLEPRFENPPLLIFLNF